MKEGKIRKFGDKEQTENRHTNVSKTESTLILSGSSLDTRGSWPIVSWVYFTENLVLYIFHCNYIISNAIVFSKPQEKSSHQKHHHLSLHKTIGQLPRVSGEDPERIRVDSVVETFDCLLDCSLSVLLFFAFYLLARSPEYPQRIRVALVFEPFICLIVLCLFFDCQQIFSFFPLSFFSFYTVQYRRVQYSTV